jgi:hypothetical protein
MKRCIGNKLPTLPTIWLVDFRLCQPLRLCLAAAPLAPWGRRTQDVERVHPMRLDIQWGEWTVSKGTPGEVIAKAKAEGVYQGCKQSTAYFVELLISQLITLSLVHFGLAPI